MDLATLLASFDRDASACERTLKEKEQLNCSGLAIDLCEISRPPSSTRSSQTVSPSVRLLALVVLKQLCERNWNITPAYLKRVKQPAEVPRIGEVEKERVQDILLQDVQLEPSDPCASKRAQIIALIARYEWLRWPRLFETLLAPAPVQAIAGVQVSPSQRSSSSPTQRLAFTLHLVLKELSNQRIGSHVETFTKIAVEAFPKLCHQLSLIIHHAVTFELMPDADAELATWICKSINSLIRGSASIAELMIAPHFEIVLASLSLKPATVWTHRLIRTLRKTCIITMKCHPKTFGDHYLSVFAERTVQCLSVPASSWPLNQSGTGEDEKLPLLIFCYAFWTEALLQKRYHSPNAVLDKGLSFVAKSALVHLRLSAKDIEQWRQLGGERFCSQEDTDAVDVLLVKPGKDETVRRAARRFLQACFDQPLPSRADLVLAEIFGTQYSDSLAIEAAFFAVQLCAARLHGKWNFDEFLKNRLLPCLVRQSTSSLSSVVGAAPRASSQLALIETACLARRTCYVIQAWIADLTSESLPLVYSTLLKDVLGRGEDLDLGVALAAVDTLQSLVMDTTSFQPLAFFQCFSFSHICGSLYPRFALGESKVRIIQLLEDILLTVTRKPNPQSGPGGTVGDAPIPGPAAMSYARDTVTSAVSVLLEEFVPFVLKREDELYTSRSEDAGSCMLVEMEALELAKVCIQVVGFASLTARSAEMCLDVVRFFLFRPRHPNDGENTWVPLLLLLLKTGDELCRLNEFLVPECLSRIRDVRTLCALVETASLLWVFSDVASRPPLDFQVVIKSLTDLLLVHHHPHGSSIGSGAGSAAERDLGVLSRTEQEAPFLVLYICRCLEMVCRSGVHRGHGELNAHCWTRIVNSCPLEELYDDRLDSRDVIERLTVIARLVLTESAFFTSIESAAAYARLCEKYIDGVGFAPSDAPWRRKLWTSSLLVALSHCRSVPETEALLPSAISCASTVLQDSESASVSSTSPPSFSSVDANQVLMEGADLDLGRREKLFQMDEFLKIDVKSVFTKVWTNLVARIGADKLREIAFGSLVAESSAFTARQASLGVLLSD